MPPPRQSRQQQNRADPRLKHCSFCPQGEALKSGAKGAQYIDYKDYPIMKPFIDYFGNIRKRYYSGVCLKHQKMLKNAVERARFMGMLAYRK